MKHPAIHTVTPTNWMTPAGSSTRVNIPGLPPEGAETVQAPRGRKDSQGKIKPSLFLDDLSLAIKGAVEVLNWAITEKQPVPYERGSWQHVPNALEEYRDALYRHILAASAKASLTENKFHEVRDPETGLLEVQHIAVNALFLLELSMREHQK
jgi:hypothetical protein